MGLRQLFVSSWVLESSTESQERVSGQRGNGVYSAPFLDSEQKNEASRSVWDRNVAQVPLDLSWKRPQRQDECWEGWASPAIRDQL